MLYTKCLGDAITGLDSGCNGTCGICEEHPKSVYTCDVQVTPKGARAYFNPVTTVEFRPIGPDGELGIVCYIEDPYRLNDFPGFLGY